MLGPIQKFLLRSLGFLTDLQTIDLSSYQPDSKEANQLLMKFVAEAENIGDSYAMTLCAACYRSGWGASADGDKAFYWAQKAALTGFPPGVAELASCYEEGLGTEKNFILSLQKMRLASEGGYASAALHLAIAFAKGTPYGLSATEAVQYAQEAFELGEVFAGHQLGFWYEQGELVPKNLVVARAWYKKAAEHGSGTACLRMAAAYLHGQLGLERNPEQSSKYIQMTESATTP